MNKFQDVQEICVSNLEKHSNNAEVTFDGAIPQLYKNRFCGLVLIPVVIDDIRSKYCF